MKLEQLTVYALKSLFFQYFTDTTEERLVKVLTSGNNVDVRPARHYTEQVNVRFFFIPIEVVHLVSVQCFKWCMRDEGM